MVEKVRSTTTTIVTTTTTTMMMMMIGIVFFLAMVVDVVRGGNCPVTSDLSSDGHLYVTNTAEFTEDCKCFSETIKEDLCTSAAATVVTSTVDTVGVLGDFECGGNCHGFVLNPNYIFWDANTKDWKELPVCQDVSSLSTCDDMDQKIQCTVSYCANGIFKCQQDTNTLCGGKVETTERLFDCPSTITIATGATAMNTLLYIFSAEGIADAKIHGLNEDLYSVITHYRTCTGHLEYTYDDEGNYCPPKVVSSFEEIEHYCMHGDISTFSDGRYQCEFQDQEACSGTIDPENVPPCEASNIPSCQDQHYYEACTHEVGATGPDDQNTNSEPDYIKFCSGGTFHCWDRLANEWCQGKVVPTYGSFDTPVCPSVIPTCDALEQFGINHQDCSCFHMNGIGGFVCGDWNKPYCKGEVDEAITSENVEVRPIKEPPGSQPSNSTQPPPPDNDFDGNDVAFARTDSTAPMKQSTTIIPLLVVSVLALVAVASFSWGYRRYRAKKKIEMRREDLAAALELTAHYRGDEDIDFIQHPRRLMIL